jgi:hypothetical protein
MNTWKKRTDAGERLPGVRRLVAIDAITEAVGRATETGRPVNFVIPGSIDVQKGATVPATMVSMTVLNYVARICARQDTDLYVTMMTRPSAIPLIHHNLVDAYTAEGKIDVYDAETAIRFGSGDSRTAEYFTASEAIRENIGAQIIIGPTGPAMAIIGPEGAARAGAMIVGGAIGQSSLQYMAVCCDYCLLGEEQFAVGAHITEDLVNISGLYTQDYIKFIFLAMVGLGSILTAAGLPWIQDLIAI